MSQAEHLKYQFPKISKKKWTLLLVSVLVTSFWLNFPLEQKLENLIAAQIKNIPGCPIHYESLSFELFMPKIKINKVIVEGRCLSSPNPLKINHLDLYFRGPSFSPMGPHFKIMTKAYNTPLEAYLTLGLSGVTVNLQDQKVKLSNLSALTGQVAARGDIVINAFLTAGTSDLKELNLQIQSKNFKLPPQNIMGLQVPELNLNNLFLRAKKGEKNKIIIEKLLLGAEESPIKLISKGTIFLNINNPKMSQVNIPSEAYFSKEFLESFGLIKLYLDKFTKKDEYYQFVLKGSLLSPQPSVN